MRPAAPGPRVGGGRVRVDAARAIAKLREYQLVERAAWVLEGIRAAVAAGASEITLAGDANDIWLSWRGEPWPAEDLTRLFDELVSPEAASERHHLRLLAAAVNSGLGLAPAHIDVIAVHDDRAIRARYTPDVLDDPGADISDSPLRNLVTESIPVPAGAQRGMRVHLRRRASLQVLSYLFGEPPELAIARGACADIPVLLTIGEHRFHRVEHGRDVVRVPLGDGLDGFLAVAEPQAVSDGTMEVAERGVVLARYPLSRAPDALPIRLLIDAPRMPTNASRSQVQRDSHPIDAAERRAHELLPALVAQLVARLEVDREPRGAARTAALALLAGIADRWQWWRISFEHSPLAPLAELPLLHDASGTPRPLRWPWSGLVYRASKSLPRELEPWVHNILWVAPGDPAERLVAGTYHDQRALRRRLRTARQQRRDHERFFAHASRPPKVISKAQPLYRLDLGTQPAASCVPGSVFDGLAGEVCIYADDGPSELVVLHHGREIEHVEHASPVRFHAVIEAPAITPAPRFRGVLRDDEYARVERAMRAGVLRAIEAVATTGGSPRLIQVGLVLARSLGASIVDPLASAPAWRTADGDHLSYAALAREHAVAIVESDIDVTPPVGRRLLRCDRDERSRLAMSAREVFQIPYSAATARPSEADVLASRLAQSSGFALAITEDTRTGAIGPAGWTEASLTLLHRGVALSTRPLGPLLVPCTIVVDSETLLPSPGWDAVLDEGSAAGDYREWQIMLVRATARALVGDRPLELLGPAEVDVHGPLGRVLCAALASVGATELLGAELLARLRAQRLWPVLGDPVPHSIDQLRAQFPEMIPYVGRGAVPVPGFSPVLADDVLASAIATLAGLPFREASLELEMRRHAEDRAKHLARHREKPVQPLALPSGESVSIEGSIVRGAVGVGTMGIEIDVLVEGRPFHVIRRESHHPLRAIVEIDETLTMPAFDGIPVDVTEEIVARVIEAVPRLILAIGAARPHLLGDAGPARRLLASCEGEHAAVLAPLRDAPIFATVQGERTSITKAQRPYIATTTWVGTWLARESDPVHACDYPIVHITDTTGEVTRILRYFHDFVHDVTEEVVKLQRTRRMARGLMPAPAIHGVAPELKRTLARFGDIGAALGHGEIALVDDDSSTALLHVGGELRKEIAIDVSPSIRIAIEAPDLIAELERDVVPESIAQQLRALQLDGPSGPPIPHAQELAIRLTRTILSEVAHAALTPLIRRNIVRAMFRGTFEPADVPHAAVFETIDGSWIDPTAVSTQLSLFGDVWSVPHRAAVSPPLDDRRVVLRMDPITADLARARGVVIIDATEELALDAIARRNRDRPLATTLALSDPRDFLAQHAIEGDGITGLRGVVGILHPAAAHRRGLHVHRAMHPFSTIPDTGTWPIVAMLDDARFTPDRTWDRPIDDAIWRHAHNAVRDASKSAFKALVTPPEDALAVQRLLGHGFGDHRFAYLRGALWVAGPPLASPPVTVIHATGTRTFTPPGETGVTGVLYAQSTDDAALARTVENLCALVHGLLVRALVRELLGDRELVTAHAAHALALGRIAIHELSEYSFPCARPDALSADELAHLFAHAKAVNVVGAADEEPGIVDDGTLLSRVVLRRLHDRIQRPSLRGTRVAPAQQARHPLDPMLDALRARFAELGLDVSSARFVDRAEPMFDYEDGLRVAGRHPRLIELAAALAAQSPWARTALDAIVAHGVTVLNVSLTAVTDAAELHAIEALLHGTAPERASF